MQKFKKRDRKMNYFDSRNVKQGDDIFIVNKEHFNENYSPGYGTDFVKLNKEHLKALLDGKVLSFGVQHEYGVCIMLDK